MLFLAILTLIATTLMIASVFVMKLADHYAGNKPAKLKATMYQGTFDITK